MRLPWQKAKPAPIDPHRPHAFQAGNDAGIGALGPVGETVGPEVGRIASTGAYSRTIGCSVPGCGRSRDDLIHAYED
jgi:hypothetical protein